MSPELSVVLMFVVLFSGIFLGFPTAFVLGGVAFLFGANIMGPDIYGLFIARLFGLMKNYTLLAVPLFLFMGVFMEKSGMAERLFNAMHILWGRFRGGLGISTIAISAVFAAATGVVGASEITIGLMALPVMLAKKYNRSMACGAICAGGTLGILIPPSVMIIVYGPIARISVGKLFLGCLLPGILLTLLYMAYIGIRCYLNSADGPPLPPEERQGSVREKFRILLTSVLPPALIILSVLGSIFFGIAAVTEAAAVGAVASMALAASYRRLNFAVLREACEQTLTITAMIMMIAVGATFFSTVFVALGGDEVITGMFINLPMGKWGILATIMLLLVFCGMFIDWMGILFIIVPLITPIAAELGFDPVWFAVLVMVNLQISFLTPPFAYSIFYLKGIAPPEVETADIYRGVMPFVGLQVFAILLLILFPEIITWLPNHFVG
ncbi:TRAP transporter large permease [Desulfogranum mediterraneum]|uniref:TRAP transporter large permease n=1 Tax=Desulfogranum mediterraneum TaxID=160661 RepID=UPI00040F232E|nr:TRAP transporter large permease subunit [Desulfogranum mediterraneum]